MERLKHWGSWGASFICWFTPEHCHHISSILGMIANFLAIIIAVPTFVFITLPKVRQSKAYKKFWG